MPYLQGHVKRNPDTGAVAVRSRFPDDRPEFERFQWSVASPVSGPKALGTSDVESWDDLFVPEAGS